MAVTLKRQPLHSTILLVDDELSIRQLFSIVLEKDGYAVKGVSNGREALEYLNREQFPNLILLDLMMPIMNGWIFFETLRADSRFDRIPVVILTAFSKSEIQIPSDVEYLKKPVDFEVLRKTLIRYCGGSATL